MIQSHRVGALRDSLSKSLVRGKVIQLSRIEDNSKVCIEQSEMNESDDRW